MKPKAFRPESLFGEGPYVRDAATGLVWHRCSHRALYADTDRSTVVYHANYLKYFELGRTSLMRDAAYPYKEIEAGGYVYPVIETGLTFYQPLHYDDPMWIHTRPGELERVRLRFDYIILHAETGAEVCRGFTRHCALNARGVPVAVDPKTGHLWKTFPQP
ncbi:MAG: acyl-CoA thioesterase [Syntrophales bacterium]|jgi:acyl-CoA thioester hydrolase|nr:acyl-CoA thioesterase [Syntrophales bacterium]MDD4339907.1 acyl-CoA thioesterase [Syntrophales bacterium]HOG06475.1 acyl-CoA thioesterase [Syntrophales bacterium]HOS77278.1 acyl-CoA thioesterase [Syntrophales bacterium]HPB70830.1 acyl-CoA thioesterase [Syntrophales bacterium]